MQTALKAAQAESLHVPQKTHEAIMLSDGQDFVVVFECLPQFISKEIQVLPTSGGNVAREPKLTSNARFSMAQIDLDGLMNRVSVEVINVVRDGNGYYRAFINCKAGVNQKIGFDTWSGAYEEFIRKALLRTWGTAILRKEEGGKTFLNLRRVKKEPAQMMLHFAIK